MKTTLKWIYTNDTAANCFFRSALIPPDLKVMLQITTRCNMQCKHCFLSATGAGTDLSYGLFKTRIIAKLIESNVKKVTLTGGEPLLHPRLLDIVSTLNNANIQTCICTNASLISKDFLEQIKEFNVHFNVSLDGMSQNSYGQFRKTCSHNDISEVLKRIELIGSYNLLNGILTTPNKFVKPEEYYDICDFAIQSGANYLLLNPLSPFGRGNESFDLALSASEMNEIKQHLDTHIARVSVSDSFRIIYIRFPNSVGKLPAHCSAGLIPYVFINRDIAISPYMVFAAENPDNNYSRQDFLVGNIYENGSIIKKIQTYQKTHRFCHRECKENLGCAAMKIARNLPLDSVDAL